MALRTDLAIDINETLEGGINGVNQKSETYEDVKITEIKITSAEAEKRLLKPQGNYITVEFPCIFEICDYGNLKTAIIDSLKKIVPSAARNILVAGLGNTEITSDAVGPVTAGKILATRHISGQFADSIGLKALRSVSVISPGVLGKTGIETTELIHGAVNAVKPDAVIVIDALASRSVSRLFKTVQLCDSGISPGSGVKNSGKEISRKTLGVPVAAIGIPTVVDAQVLAFELTGRESAVDIDMLVTPKDADILCHRISEILAEALNLFLQPETDSDIILSLV